ncbi:hypothetical protein [Endozoicomonas sp. ONNA1]|uniref:hypothetical protein n=1 Tax=Endozoicomonas sp. ONNA1 TaxID=2828740 RepID=UPI002148D18E|nr:hypothetical protein [Endozoicomonas sp. ONNA1]
MFITRLYLKNYARFILTGIKEIDIKTTKQLQVILGSNGSGKTSILAALLPLPASPTDFSQGGVKILELEHKGSDYVLTSHIEKKASHSFVKDGLELNQGGTATVQRELAEIELGFDARVEKILNGQLPFTEMGPQLRREWLTRISGMNLDYATDLYQKIKTQHRDNIGALKHSKRRLGIETERLKDSETIKGLNIKAKELITNLEAIGQLRERTPQYSLLKPQWDEKVHRLKSLSKDILGIGQRKPPVNSISSMDDVRKQLTDINGQLEHSKSRLNDHLKELEHLQGLFEETESLKDQNETKLKLQLSELKAQQAELNGHSELDECADDLSARIGLMLEIKGDLLNQLAQCTGSALNVPEREQWQDIHCSYDSVCQKLRQQQTCFEHLNDRRQRVLEAREEQCPSCQYVWKPGVSEQELEHIESKLENLNRVIKDLTETKSTLDQQLEAIRTRRGERELFYNLQRNYPALRVVWADINKTDWLSTNPDQIANLFNDWETKFHERLAYDELSIKINETYITLERLAKQKEIESETQLLKDQIQRLESKISVERLRTVELEKQKQNWIDYYEYVSDLIEKIEQCQCLYREVESEIKVLMNAKVQDHLTEKMSNAQVQLAAIQNQLNEQDTIAGILNSLNDSLKELELEAQALALLDNALSPVDGLISDYLNYFIEHLIQHINDIIAQVWEYDMEILPCKNDKGELDYKFPIQIKGESKLIPDIKMGSKAQTDMINFAFVLMVMNYLDMTDYPLLLDELGRTFDDKHRSKLIDFNKMLLETKQCSQLFLVSHFMVEHGAFANSQVCVLDKTNIAVPENYNEHVTIR